MGHQRQRDPQGEGRGEKNVKNGDPIDRWTNCDFIVPSDPVDRGAPYLLSIISKRRRNATVVLGDSFIHWSPLGPPYLVSTINYSGHRD